MHDTDIRAQLEEERHIIEAATEGPWEADPYGPSIVVNPREENEYGDPELIADCNDCNPDAAFIAHARTALPVRNAQIEAVLELHAPADFGECNECSNGTPYPCATVRAIEEAA